MIYNIDIPTNLNTRLLAYVVKANNSRGPGDPIVTELDVINSWLLRELKILKKDDDENTWGNKRKAYEGLTPAKQAQIDAILSS